MINKTFDQQLIAQLGKNNATAKCNKCLGFGHYELPSFFAGNFQAEIVFVESFNFASEELIIPEETPEFFKNSLKAEMYLTVSGKREILNKILPETLKYGIPKWMFTSAVKCFQKEGRIPSIQQIENCKTWKPFLENGLTYVLCGSIAKEHYGFFEAENYFKIKRDGTTFICVEELNEIDIERIKKLLV
jgi:hypothetical protein